MAEKNKKDYLEEKISKQEANQINNSNNISHIEEEKKALNYLYQKHLRGEGLLNEERDFIANSTILDPMQKEELLIRDKLLKGEKLNKKEEKFLEEISRREQGFNNNPHSNEIHQNFLKRAEELKKKGGKKILHWTDTHLKIDDLESKLNFLTKLNNFNPNEDIFVNTGDILKDFINPRNLKSLARDRIIEEGRLTKSQAEEFKSSYSVLLQKVGLTNLDLETGGTLLGERGEYQLNQFVSYLFTDAEPQFLTKDELERFREAKKKVLKNLRFAIKNHAKEYYQRVKEIFEKEGLNPKNTLLVAGNHDVEEVMYEVLGEYMIAPGQVKEVQGKKFGNLISGSTGEALGLYLSDVLGWRDIRKDPKIIYNTDAFKKLKSKLHDAGFVDITDENLIFAIKHAKKKESLGISNSELVKYFNKYIQPQVDLRVQREIDSIPNIDPNSVDYFVGHGDPTSIYAGAEEKKVLELLKGTGAKYLHGHIHEPTSHKESGIYFLNPGTGQNLNYGLYLDHKDVNEVLFAQHSPIKQGLEYQAINLEDLIDINSKSENELKNEKR